jgi:hypothetical protein
MKAGESMALFIKPSPPVSGNDIRVRNRLRQEA